MPHDPDLQLVLGAMIGAFYCFVVNTIWSCLCYRYVPEASNPTPKPQDAPVQHTELYAIRKALESAVGYARRDEVPDLEEIIEWQRLLEEAKIPRGLTAQITTQMVYGFEDMSEKPSNPTYADNEPDVRS